MLFGNRYDIDDPDFLAVRKYSHIITSTSRYADISFQLPWTRKFYKSQAYKDLSEAFILEGAYIRKRLEEHEGKFNPDDIGDFCDALIKSVKEEKEHWNEVCS